MHARKIEVYGQDERLGLGVKLTTSPREIMC
jgi:hypothetical protein